MEAWQKWESSWQGWNKKWHDRNVSHHNDVLKQPPWTDNRMFYQAAISDKASAGSERLAYVPLLFSFSTCVFRINCHSLKHLYSKCKQWIVSRVLLQPVPQLWIKGLDLCAKLVVQVPKYKTMAQAQIKYTRTINQARALPKPRAQKWVSSCSVMSYLLSISGARCSWPVSYLKKNVFI